MGKAELYCVYRTSFFNGFEYKQHLALEVKPNILINRHNTLQMPADSNIYSFNGAYETSNSKVL